jgi:hypothetical protein
LINLKRLDRKTINHIGGKNRKIAKHYHRHLAHALLSGVTHFGHGAAIGLRIFGAGDQRLVSGRRTWA